ncbi:AIM24 family protein [Desulfosporosinus metallidurans]|uniref:AIM24 family protein n=1 Tax=Desulfosporosinus metallidurans TaxID=1888891 RepID=UPI0009FAB1D7
MSRVSLTRNIEYTYDRVHGFSNMLFGGTGFFIDKFNCTHGDGVLWLHGCGNVFSKELASNEQIDVESGGWIYKSPSVRIGKHGNERLNSSYRFHRFD